MEFLRLVRSSWIPADFSTVQPSQDPKDIATPEGTAVAQFGNFS